MKRRSYKTTTCSLQADDSRLSRKLGFKLNENVTRDDCRSPIPLNEGRSGVGLKRDDTGSTCNSRNSKMDPICCHSKPRKRRSIDFESQTKVAEEEQSRSNDTKEHDFVSDKELEDSIIVKIRKGHDYLTAHRVRYAITCFHHAVHLQKILIKRESPHCDHNDGLIKVAGLYELLGSLTAHYLNDNDTAYRYFMRSIQFYQSANIDDMMHSGYKRALSGYRSTKNLKSQEINDDELEREFEDYLQLIELNLHLNDLEKARKRLTQAFEVVDRIASSNIKSQLRQAAFCIQDKLDFISAQSIGRPNLKEN